MRYRVCARVGRKERIGGFSGLWLLQLGLDQAEEEIGRGRRSEYNIYVRDSGSDSSSSRRRIVKNWKVLKKPGNRGSEDLAVVVVWQGWWW